MLGLPAHAFCLLHSTLQYWKFLFIQIAGYLLLIGKCFGDDGAGEVGRKEWGLGPPDSPGPKSVPSPLPLGSSWFPSRWWFGGSALELSAREAGAGALAHLEDSWARQLLLPLGWPALYLELASWWRSPKFDSFTA